MIKAFDQFPEKYRAKYEAACRCLFEDRGGSRRASLTMMFRLAQSASRCWRRLKAHRQIILVLIFTDGVLQIAA